MPQNTVKGDSPQLVFSIFQSHPEGLCQRGRSWFTGPSSVAVNMVKHYLQDL